jgi:hypothetical protein
VALSVDVDKKKLPYAGRNLGDTPAGWLKGAAYDLVQPREDTPERQVIVKDLGEFLYRLDAQIQDRIASNDSLSAAYQLARGVAEIRWGWAFEATDGESRRVRGHLLGPDRAKAIDRQLTRIDAYYDPVTLRAIELSLDTWRSAFDRLGDIPDKAWQAALIEQATRWHDLILGQRDGASFVTPTDLLAKPASILEIAKRLAPEVAVSAVGAILLVLAAGWLASPGGENSVALIAAALGIAGVTAAGISAKARAQAMDLIATVREEFYRALVANRAVVQPPRQSPQDPAR